jgi:type IV fimbrial biogenesis protein FimT
VKKVIFNEVQGGFTLIELMVSLSVLGILLAIASGSFSSMMASARQRVLGNDLLRDLRLTRSEAILRGERVVMCVATSTEKCTNSGGWHQGWLMFVDSNNNGARDASEQTLRYRAAAPKGWVISGNRPVAHYVSYDALGGTRMTGGAFQAGTITICQSGVNNSAVRKVIINSAGRPRSQFVEGERCE